MYSSPNVISVIKTSWGGWGMYDEW